MALGFVWIFPTISFEIGVLIGTVSVGMILYLFFNIMKNPFPGMYLPSIDDDYIVDKDYDERDTDRSIFPRSTRSTKRKRR